MSSELLPFKPINRASSKSLTGCVSSTPGYILVGSLLAFLGVLILGAAGLTAYFLTQPNVMAAPTVEITSPANDSEVMLHTPLQVRAAVSAPEGITRLELWQSGQHDRHVCYAGGAIGLYAGRRPSQQALTKLP